MNMEERTAPDWGNLSQAHAELVKAQTLRDFKENGDELREALPKMAEGDQIIYFGVVHKVRGGYVAAIREEAQTMTRDEFEAEFLRDPELSGRYFKMLLDDPKVVLLSEGVTAYAWQKYQDETTTAHTDGWKGVGK